MGTVAAAAIGKSAAGASAAWSSAVAVEGISTGSMSPSPLMAAITARISGDTVPQAAGGGGGGEARLQPYGDIDAQALETGGRRFRAGIVDADVSSETSESGIS